MTMQRKTKADKLGMLKKIQGGHAEQAHSPKLRAAMIADHGTPTYSPAAWIEHRMGRTNYQRIPVTMIRADRAAQHRQALRRVARVA